MNIYNVKNFCAELIAKPKQLRYLTLKRSRLEKYYCQILLV